MPSEMLTVWGGHLPGGLLGGRVDARPGDPMTGKAGRCRQAISPGGRMRDGRW